jgi:ABC-type multidrug transport system fused ATPase/permease subunit
VALPPARTRRARLPDRGQGRQRRRADDFQGDDRRPQRAAADPGASILLLALYGILRFSTSLFTELREILFARVTQRAVRQASLEVFRHLHALSLRFHLDRQTGGVSRDIERAAARSPA